MAIEVSPDLKEFVEKEVSSGHFDNPSSVVEHALRLMQRDREEAMIGINAGLADEKAGRVQPLDAAFADLRHEFGVAEDA